MASTRTKIYLKSLKGRVLCQWHHWPLWATIQEELADWADCQPEDVACIETPDGDFLTVEGIPVAYMEREQIVVPGPSAQIIPITVNGRVVPAEIFAAE